MDKCSFAIDSAECVVDDICRIVELLHFKFID
jgi:hypothetical protein